MPANTKRVMEASALLVLFSFFALVEGVIRMTAYSKPSDEMEIDYWDTMEGTQVPVGVFLIAACAEAFVGILGVFVGFSQLFFEHGSPAVSRTFALVQAICSAFVFGVFVVAAPIMEARETTGVPGLLTQKEHRYMILLGGLAGSLTFCFAVLGGQFSMILRLLSAQNRAPEAGSVFQAVVWSANQMLMAGSTLYVGIHLLTKEFSSSTDPAMAVPHFVFYPLISIITGGIMLAYGIAGVFSACSASLSQSLPLLWMVATLAMMANFSWSFGLQPGLLTMTVPYAAQHSGLVLAVTLLPVIHAWRIHRPIGEDIGTESDANKTTYDTGVERALPQAPMTNHLRSTRSNSSGGGGASYIGDEGLA